MTTVSRLLPPVALTLLCAFGPPAIFPRSAAAAPAIECHCFQDRAYDPASPGKTDRYLLATTTNTLLAAAYGFPKKEVVRGRMAGASGENLWVAAYAAERLGARRDDLLARREQAGSWRGALTALGAPLEPLGPAFVVALLAAGDEPLARVAAAETLVERVGADRGEVDELARRGASVPETVLSVLLGRWSGRPAAENYERVKSGGATWSGILAGLGRFPEGMENDVPRELKPAGHRR
jgi:hypothetical protein